MEHILGVCDILFAHTVVQRSHGRRNAIDLDGFRLEADFVGRAVLVHELDRLFGLFHVKGLILLLQNAVRTGIVVFDRHVHDLILAEVAGLTHQAAGIERAVLLELDQHKVRCIGFAFENALRVNRSGFDSGFIGLGGLVRFRCFGDLGGFIGLGGVGCGRGRLRAGDSAEQHQSSQQNGKKLLHRFSS